MKFAGFLFLLITATVLAANAPFQPHDEQRFISIEAASAEHSSSISSIISAAALLEARTAVVESGSPWVKKGVYIFATPAAAESTVVLAGAVIPANSIIVSLIVRVKDEIISADNNTISIGCGPGGDLIDATNFIGQPANYLLQATVTMPYLALTDCTISGTIGVGASGVTAGTLEVYAQYVTLL